MSEVLDFNFAEPYSKLKVTQESLQDLIQNMIEEYYSIKSKELNLNTKIDDILSVTDTNSPISNMENQNMILKKAKLLKEYRSLLQQYRSKESMLLRNLTELSKSQVDQPFKMQGIIESKYKIDNNQTTLQQTNGVSISGLSFQDIIKIGENLITKSAGTTVVK